MSQTTVRKHPLAALGVILLTAAAAFPGAAASAISEPLATIAPGPAPVAAQARVSISTSIDDPSGQTPTDALALPGFPPLAGVPTQPDSPLPAVDAAPAGTAADAPLAPGVPTDAPPEPGDQEVLPVQPRAPTPHSAHREPSPLAMARRQRLEGKVRALMNHFGIQDRIVQDALIRYINDEVRARQPVRARGNVLLRALSAPGQSDAQLRAALDAFRAQLAQDRTRRQNAEDALNDLIGFRSNPRLEAILLMFGVIGDGPMMTGLAEPARMDERGTRPGPPRPTSMPAPSPRPAPALLVAVGQVNAHKGRWIELKPIGQGPAERYFVRWIPAPNDDDDGNWDQDTMRLLSTFKRGEKVRIVWFASAGKRIAQITREP